MIQFLRRFASRAVQRAHARVSRDNERYVREAIARDAENERLTQENKQLAEERDRYKAAVEELRRKQVRWTEIGTDQAHELAELRLQLKALTGQLTELDELHAEASARLEQAEEELAGYRLEAGQ